MTPEALERLDSLAQRHGAKTPSDYIRSLNDETDPTGYWRWCIDDAAAKCANYLAQRRERDIRRKRDGFEEVVPES